MAPNTLLQDFEKQLKSGPDLPDCESIIGRLEADVEHRPGNVDAPMLKMLASFQKSLRTVKRRAGASESQRWNNLLQRLERISSVASTAPVEDEEVASNESSAETTIGLPGSANEYFNRLKKQKKEIYKNPPVLPPPTIIIYPTKCPLPSRDKKQRLSFIAGKEGESIQLLLTDFRPNVTPEEVLRGGAFGGTYFRSITSAVTGQSYSGNAVLKDTVPDEWIQGLDRKRMLTSQTYNAPVNKFGVKCGGSLGMWESSGWISDADLYGWFQWYCRFYQGRRCSDDSRQISRWLKCAGPKGRFKSQLCNKILAANAKSDDPSISPVIRQTLFHWGLLVNDDVVEAPRKGR
jgi:hypothetical protein